jgi:hypothetical protein
MTALNLNLCLSLFPLLWFYKILFQGIYVLADATGGGAAPVHDEDEVGDISMDVDAAVYGECAVGSARKVD